MALSSCWTTLNIIIIFIKSKRRPDSQTRLGIMFNFVPGNPRGMEDTEKPASAKTAAG